MKVFLLLNALFYVCVGQSILDTNPLSRIGTFGVNILKRIPVVGGIGANLVEGGKQIVGGHSFGVLSNLVNRLCLAVDEDDRPPVDVPNIELLEFQLTTACNTYNYPLLMADDMWRSPEFDPQKKVVIMITGWTRDVNKTEALSFAKAYNCRGDVNFVLLDMYLYINTLYRWSAVNTQTIGQLLAVGLVYLTQVVPVENIHLIGHSLGAQIAGAAGRYFYLRTGVLLPRITGLDPARPCFTEGGITSLQRTDAAYVDVIHTNPGGLGKEEPLGHADFYPGGLQPLSPGCFTIVCAHTRAIDYFTESVYPGNEYNFIGNLCGSSKDLSEKNCYGYAAPMGYAASPNAQGIFVVDVNELAPFGKNYNPQTYGSLENCGRCSSYE